MLHGGSGYFTCKQNMKLVTAKFKSGGLHEKHVVATWNLGNHLSICFWAQGNHEYWKAGENRFVCSIDSYYMRERERAREREREK